MGAILLFAVALTAYASVVHNDVPRWGEEAEVQWDAQVGVTSGVVVEYLSGLPESSLVVRIPPSPEPRALDVPLLGKVAPARPAASLSFEPRCTNATVEHGVRGASNVTDLGGGSRGCLAYRAESVYSPAYSYRIEMGGVLRTQGADAVILTGPPLVLENVSGTQYRVSFALPSLTGPPATVGAGGNPVALTLLPVAAVREAFSTANAANATIDLRSPYPEAWKDWFLARFQDAGFVASRASPPVGETTADYEVVCLPADCSRDETGAGRVLVTVHGPRTDANDLVFNVGHGVYDVVLG